MALIMISSLSMISEWFSRISISAKKRLQIVQNKVIRFVLGIPPRTHLGCSEFSRVNILPVKYRLTRSSSIICLILFMALHLNI